MQCVRLPLGGSYGCCEPHKRPSTPLEPDFGRRGFLSRDARDDLVFLSTPPATSAQSRQSMQHVDELTGKSMCAYSRWRQSDENATFQRKKKLKITKHCSQCTLYKKHRSDRAMALSSKGHAFRRPELWLCQRRTDICQDLC